MPDRESQNRLILSHLRFASWIASKYAGLGLDDDDLVQEGCIGLIKAARRFRPERGVTFKTYSFFQIRACIERALANQSRMIRLPCHVSSKVWQAISSLTMAMGREPTIEEIARAAKLKTQVLSNLLTLSQEPLSLEGAITGDSETCLGDIVKDEKAGEAFKRIDASDFPLLEGLTETERKVLSLRFGLNGQEEMTLEAIGEVIGRTSERIRQIEAKALGKLRRRISLFVMPGEIG